MLIAYESGNLEVHAWLDGNGADDGYRRIVERNDAAEARKLEMLAKKNDQLARRAEITLMRAEELHTLKYESEVYKRIVAAENAKIARIKTERHDKIVASRLHALEHTATQSYVMKRYLPVCYRPVQTNSSTIARSDVEAAEKMLVVEAVEHEARSVRT